MSFSHGRDTHLYAHGQDVSGYLKSVSVSGSVDTAECTCFGNTSKAYVVGLPDATLSGEGFVDGAAGAGDSILAALFAAASKIFSYYPAGDTRGNRGSHMSAAQTSYEITSDIGDACAFTFEAQSDTGMEGGTSLKAGADSITTSTSETSVDNGAASTNGGAAYLHVLSKSGGTNITVIIEHSTDNGTDPWTTIASFTAETAEDVAQRVAIAAGTTIKRYVRATWTLGGGGTWKINVALVRK